MEDILKSSVVCRLYARIVNSITDSAKSGAIGRMIAFIITGFRSYLKSSAIVGFFSQGADRLRGQIKGSVLLDWFLLIKPSDVYSDNSVFTRAFYWVLGVFRALTHSIKLDKLLQSSIFAKPWLWCGLAIALAPIMPTKAIIGLVALSYFSLLFNLSMDRKRELVFFPINKYVWIYALVYILATVASVSFSDSLYVGAITVLFVLFFIVFTNSIRTRRQLRGVVIAMVWAGVLVALFGFVQFMFPGSFSGGWVDENMFDYRFRVYSTLQNPNVLGEYFLLIIPFAFACLLTAKSNQGRLFYIIATIAMLACLVLTYSRGSYLGIIISIAVFLVMLDRRFILPGIILAVIIVLVLPTTFIERFSSIGNTSDGSTSYRVFIWLGTIAMLRHYWFSGIGPGEWAFKQVYPVYSYNAISAPHAHNLFLQITCDTGVIGLFIFLAILYQYFKNMFHTLRVGKPREQRTFVIAGISSIIGFIVQSMTDYTFYNYRVMLLFWAVLGISMLFTRYDRMEESND